MTEQKATPGIKAALEFGPLLAFFAGYLMLKDRVFTIAGTEYSGFIIITAAFIPLLAVTTYLLYRITGQLSKMQILTLVIVVVMGGLTIWFNDERFFKMKPTIIYGLFASVLGFGLLQKKSYLQIVMSEVLPLKSEGWMILTRRVTFLFIGLAVLNELVWRNFSTDAWVNFKTFGLSIGVFAFLMLQGKLFQEYGVEEPAADET